MVGDFSLARHHAEAMLTAPSAGLVYFGLLYWIHRETGTLADLLATLGQVANENPSIVGFRAALALAYIDTDQPEVARDLFAELVGPGWERIPRDYVWPGTVTLLAEAAAYLGDGAAAAQLYDAYRAHSGHVVVMANIISLGAAADRYLGMLALTMGDLELAEGHLRAALGLETSLPAPPAVARTQLWLARLLLRRGTPADRSEALELLAQSRAAAESMGMGRLAYEAGVADSS